MTTWGKGQSHFDLYEALTEKPLPLFCDNCKNNWLSNKNTRCPRCGSRWIGVDSHLEGRLTVYEEEPE